MLINLILFFLITYAAIYVLKFILQKIFGIESVSRNKYAPRYFNELHRKVSWGMRAVTLIAGVGILLLVYSENNPSVYFLVPAIVLLVVNQLVTAFFEWRYSEKPKQAIFTLGEMAVWVTAIVLVIQHFHLMLGGFEGVVTEKTDTSFMVEVTSFTLEIGQPIREVHMTDHTIFKGAVPAFEELEEGSRVQVIPFDLPQDFDYILAGEVTVDR